MKVIDIYLLARELSGTDSSEEYVLSEEKDSQLLFINRIFSDLCISEAKDINEEINLKFEQVDACVYGVAMLMAMKNSDSYRGKMFSRLYEGKRAAAKCSTHRIKDAMPNFIG